MTARWMLRWVLRCAGGGMLLALLFVFCPFDWMAILHAQIGLGTLEYTPLLSYLIRTLSALYATVGAILLFISFDVDRYRPLVHLLGIIAVLGGIGVTVLDALLRLPVFWTILEGPLTVLLGVVLIALTRAEARRAAS
ncbi:MAG: hypothetical protein MUC88_01900 [Planctomycetes bacterium]|nr:hypothetical protein [Planctomycetota bacterium]